MKEKVKTWRMKLIILSLLICHLSFSSAQAQDFMTVKGQVVDNHGEPLIGATIQMKGTSTGSVSDLDGNFVIQVNKGSTLVVTYIGYTTQEVKAAPTLKVVLKEDNHTLNEVVVVGYGTMKRSDITGSVVSVKAEDMQQTSAATMDQMLQGRAAGVQLTENSGAAGSSSSIQIRGINSLSSTNEPVYVIDGAIIRSESGDDTYSNPLADLNPNDVESIEVLKDASATAIYGAQAANGVIIVNMKKGKEGAPKIDFKTSVGWDMLPKKLDVMKLPDLARWMNGVNEVNGNLASGKASDYFANPDALGDGTDWQDALFRTGLRQDYNLSVRGGNKNISYSVSGGYLNQKGIVINNDFERYTLRGSMDVNAYKWLDFGLTFSLAQTEKNTGMSQWGVVGNALGQTPNIPLKNPDGSWGKSGYNSETQSYQPNPVAIASVTTRENSTTSTRGNVYFTLKPWQWLSWRNEFTLDQNTDNYRYLLPAYDFGGTKRDYSTHESAKTYNRYSSLKSVATGKWSLNVHDITLMMGYEKRSFPDPVRTRDTVRKSRALSAGIPRDSAAR